MTAAVTTPCVILAGGLGTRLRGVVGDLPKCLAPVGDRSFLEMQIAFLAAAGVSDIVLSLGYMADKVISALAARPGDVPVRHVIEREQLGTGGAIAHVLDTLALDEVLVANGDTYLDGDLGAMLRPLDRNAGELLRMAAISVADRTRFGGVDVDASGRVTRFLDKGRSDGGRINAGLYRLCRAALPALGTTRPYSLETDVMPGLARASHLTAVGIDGTFIDIGVPDDYRLFCERHVR